GVGGRVLFLYDQVVTGMAERQRYRVDGRRMGRAGAAPTARAARRYLDGEEAPIGGANSAPSVPQTTLPVE
ncbi:hypothetical protein NKH48_11085, partial [Mesorhizobium sp. M1233]